MDDERDMARVNSGEWPDYEPGHTKEEGGLMWAGNYLEKDYS